MWLVTILGFLFSFLWALFFLPVVADFAIRWKWYDLPNARKVHRKPIVAIGGVGIFSGVWLSFSLSNSASLSTLGYFILGSSLLFVISLRDDVKSVQPLIRLISQLLIGSICFLGGVRIESLHGLMGVGEIAYIAQYILTVLTIVTVINAYNMIDGINGLLGCLSLLACFVFCMIFWTAGEATWSLLAMSTAGAVLGFLKYNFGKASMFMGDNGSTFLGLLFAVFFIRSLSIEAGPGEDYVNMVTTLSIIFLPVLDLLRVSITRIVNGKSPFLADQNHIHHLLLARGKSHVLTTVQITLVQFLLFVLTQALLPQLTPFATISVLVLVYLSYVSMLKISLWLTAIKTMELQRKELNLIE